jgi:hypothetical protein
MYSIVLYYYFDVVNQLIDFAGIADLTPKNITTAVSLLKAMGKNAGTKKLTEAQASLAF